MWAELLYDPANLSTFGFGLDDVDDAIEVFVKSEVQTENDPDIRWKQRVVIVGREDIGLRLERLQEALDQKGHQVDIGLFSGQQLIDRFPTISGTFTCFV